MRWTGTAGRWITVSGRIGRVLCAGTAAWAQRDIGDDFMGDGEGRCMGAGLQTGMRGCTG